VGYGMWKVARAFGSYIARFDENQHHFGEEDIV